jgi:NADPH2:quinone reductase
MLEAATLPETMFTVWSNVFDRAALKKDETFLVHGGASGIGVSAIQIVSALGHRVFTTAGSDDRCRTCEKLGAELAVNYKSEDFVARLKERTAGKGVDVILDFIGGEYIAKNIDLLAIEGRLVQISLLNGGQVNINFGPVLLKRLVLTGSTLRARPNPFKQAIATALKQHVWPLLESKAVKPIVSRTYRLEQMAEAHRHLLSGDNVGKIAIEVKAS